jgi:hypothetical protein
MTSTSSYKTYEEAKRRKPVRWWHEAIIDDMLQYPRSSMKERSVRLKYSVDYLSLVMNTDMFRAFYEERRAAFNARLSDSIQQKTGEAANKALDLVLETLEKKRDKIPFAELSEFTDRTLERLGYGVKSGSPVQVNIVAPAITREQLAEARRYLRAVEDQRQKVIEAEPVPKAPAPHLAVLPSEPVKEGS